MTGEEHQIYLHVSMGANGLGVVSPLDAVA
ncbi:MAG: hypothetical protein ACI8UZ_002250 [Akkermansiaceae bacterium]|jgi:hypothetical protein